MHIISLLFVFLLFCCFNIRLIKSQDNSLIYTVPEPQIDVHTNGFRVKIPDENGITLFAFHGNINRPLPDLEAGFYSKDILTKTDGHWVFEDLKTHLKIGDKIYYWLFVIKYGLGYRYDHGEFTVRQINPVSKVNQTKPELFPHKNEPNTTDIIQFPPETIHSEQIDHRVFLQTSTCCQLYLNSSKIIVDQERMINDLIKENNLLVEIARRQQITEYLFLTGMFPTLENSAAAKEFVQKFLLENLNIRDVSVSDAKIRSSNLIMFTVKDIKTKVKILKSAGEKLKFSHYKIDYVLT